MIMKIFFSKQNKTKKSNGKTIGEHFYNLRAVSDKTNILNAIKLKKQQTGENICYKCDKKKKRFRSTKLGKKPNIHV